MKAFFVWLTFFVVLIFIFASSTSATEPVAVYLFHGQGCPHCAKEIAFLQDYQTKNPNQAGFYLYEVYYQRANAQLLAQVGQALGVQVGAVPTTIIGDQVITGFDSAETTGKLIAEAIDRCRDQVCPDVVVPFLENLAAAKTPLPTLKLTAPTPTDRTISLPFFDNVDLRNFSLPALTIILATLDGFNPCAMWILIFLISLLLPMRNRKKMWLLGSTFIFASGFMYFLFLSAWLNLFLWIGFLPWVRFTVGLVAVSGGIWQLKKFYERQTGCEVGNLFGRQKVFEQLKEITADQRLALALIGVIILAVSVNFIELVCSAGLPAIFTQVLSLSHLPSWQYYAYLLLYVFIFMLDDLLIFAVAMITLRETSFGTKYSKYSSLLGGMITLLIGVLLLFRPEWLMFG